MEVRIKPKSIKYPTIVQLNGDYYLVSKMYKPGGTNCCERKETHIAINLKDGKWFEWDCDPDIMFGDAVNMFPDNTEFKIIL